MTPQYLEYLGQRVKEARKKLDLTQAEAAELAEIDYRHLQNIEAGKVDMKASTILRLQEKLSFWEVVLFSGISNAEQKDLQQKEPAHMAILDEKGHIIYTNEPWRKFGDKNHLQSEDSANSNYFLVCERSASEGVQTARLFMDKIKSLSNNSGFSFSYSCHAPWEHRWFDVHVEKIILFDRLIYIVVHTPILIRPSTEKELEQ
jgi:transcriptional regulator with XRE-family HTH domain